jgi:hypothetical protein
VEPEGDFDLPTRELSGSDVGGEKTDVEGEMAPVVAWYNDGSSFGSFGYL